MICPICRSDIQVFYYREESYCSPDYVESSANCPRCDYEELDEYDGHYVSFGDYFWGWSNQISQDQLAVILADIDQKISMSRPNFIYSKYRYYEVDNDPIPF